MGKLTLRDAGGGGRRRRARFMTLAMVLLLTTTVANCNLDSPSSPNNSTALTGQNGNTPFNFTGTVTISVSSSTLVADGISTLLVRAEVKAADGSPIANLTGVVFSANLGGFVNPEDPTGPLLAAISATTFNGIAVAEYASFSSGSAEVTASVGSKGRTANVEVEPPPERGVIRLFFLTDGAEQTTTTGAASVASPFIRELNAVVIDPESGNPLQGVEVQFSIIKDSTTGSGIGPAKFVGPSKGTTDTLGVAVAQIRAVGTGDIAVIAQMIDSNTGEVAGTSNQVIAITTAAFIATLSVNGTGTCGAPCVHNLTVNVQDTLLQNIGGVTVRFTITSDNSTSGASLSSANAVTNVSGNATTTVTVPDNGGGPSAVTVIAEVIDSQNKVLATSNSIVVTGT